MWFNGVKLKSVLVPVVSKLHDPKAVSEVLSKYRRELGSVVSSVAGEVDDVPKVRALPEDVDAYVVAVLTGGTEYLITELGRRNIPLALVAHDTQNSLAAALEVTPRLKREGVPVKLFLLKDSVGKEVSTFLKAAHAYRTLKGSRIVLIGDPSPWLVYSSLQLDAVKELLDLEVVRVGNDVLASKISEVGDEEVSDLRKSLEHIEFVGAEAASLGKALKVYSALKSLLSEVESKVFTIRCFDLIKSGVTACLALSLLNDEGYVAGCEGDVPALVTMAALSSISGIPAFIGNIAWVEGSRVLVAHCTVPMKLVSRFRFRTHFESGISIGIEGWPRKGSEVTLARLDALNKVLRAGRGIVINEGPVMPSSCRTQFLISFEGGADIIVDEPIGNHYVLTLGNWVEPLRYLAELLDLRFERIGGSR